MLHASIIDARKAIDILARRHKDAECAERFVLEQIQKICKHHFELEGQDHNLGRKTWTLHFVCSLCESYKSKVGKPLCPHCMSPLARADRTDAYAQAKRRAMTVCHGHSKRVAFRCSSSSCRKVSVLYENIEAAK